jgi:glycosyltransferase involved in cell wall biosynthesis
MKISIITVCYNSALTIRDTFESVLNQTYSDIEYIVVDGNSNDETLFIIKEYEPRFNGKIYWISEPDNGLYDAMNKGIQMATGKIIGILNSDDRYTNGSVLEIVHDQFDANNCQSLYGDLFVIKGGKLCRYWRAGRQRSFKLGWMPPHPAFFLRKEIYEKYGLFRLDCGTAADYELMLRILEKYHISTVYLPKPLVVMSDGGVSNMSIKSRLRSTFFDSYAWKLNNLKPELFTFPLKKFSKIGQFIINKQIYKEYLSP